MKMTLAPLHLMCQEQHWLLGVAPHLFEMEQAEEPARGTLLPKPRAHRAACSRAGLFTAARHFGPMCLKGRVLGLSLLIPFCREFQKT